MRILSIAAAAALLLLPAIAPANASETMACGAARPSAQAGATDLSAATKKPLKKMAKIKIKKEKVEYLRAAPM